MTIRLFQAALAAASLALLPSLAQAQQPSEQPPIGDPVPFELPEIRSFTLDNGLEVTFIPFGLAPTVNLSLQVRAANLDDGAQTWLADLTGAMMEEGAGGRSGEEIATEIAAMGGAINIGVGRHTTGLTTGVLSQYGPDAVAFLIYVFFSHIRFFGTALLLSKNILDTT